MTEKKVRDIIKSVLRSQLLDVPNKAEVRKIAKEEAEKAVKKTSKDAMSEKEVKDMISDANNLNIVAVRDCMQNLPNEVFSY